MLSLLLLLTALTPPAAANGQTTHQWITLHAVAVVEDPSLAALLARPDLQAALLNGTMFPDGGYAVGDNYGELAHWEPFQRAYLRWILDTYGSPPTTAEGEQHLAFFLGLASHGMADQLFDSTFMECSKAYDPPASWADYSMDEATDVEMAAQTGAAVVPEAWFPGELFEEIYASQDYTVTTATMSRGQGLLQAALGVVGIMGATPSMLENYREQFPWATTHLNDEAVWCGPPCEARLTARYWEALWREANGEGSDWARGEGVLGILPENGSLSVTTDASRVEARLSIVLSYGMDPSSLTPERVLVTDAEGTPVPVTLDLFYGTSSHVLNLHPQADWAPDTDYRVTLQPGLTTFDGRALAAPLTLDFTTRYRPPVTTDSEGDTAGVTSEHPDDTASGAKEEASGCGCAVGGAVGEGRFGAALALGALGALGALTLRRRSGGRPDPRA